MKGIIIIVFCFLVVFLGCRPSHNVKQGKGKTKTNLILSETKFFLDSIIGESVNSYLFGEKKIYISFDQSGGKFSGFAGCNRFFGEFQLEEDSIHFGIITATKLACPALDSEQYFLESLNEKTFLIQKANTKLILDGEYVTIKFIQEQLNK